MKTIAPAFIKAKKAFGPALKDKTNPAFRSKYADLGACIDSVEDALLANGIAFVQETFDDSTGVTVETVFIHESGETMRCGKLHVPAAKQDPQGYGSALTYARRYSLMAACGIAPEDDDGNAANRPAKKTAPANEPMVSDRQAADIDALISEVGADKVAFLAWVAQMAGHDIKAVAQIPAAAVSKVVSALEKKRKPTKESA